LKKKYTMHVVPTPYSKLDGNEASKVCNEIVVKKGDTLVHVGSS
jgi:hypothetical protein